MKYFLYTLVACCMVIGCVSKEKKGIQINDVIVIDSLFGQTIKVSENMLMPTKAVTLANKLIIYDGTDKDIFKVFKLPNLEFLYGFGQKGRGPNEFPFINSNSMKIMNNNLMFMDNRKIKYLEVTDEGMNINKSVRLPIEKAPINRLQMINDSIYFSDLMSDDKNSLEHKIFNINKRELVGEFGEYPISSNLNFKTAMAKYQAYLKSSVVHPDSNIFAVFYLHFNKLKIYNKNGDLLKEINISNQQSKYSMDNPANNIIYRVEPVASGKYIYILNINKSKKEIQNNVAEFKPKLEVWNWKGELLKKIQLDKPIISFTISEKFNKLYGVSFAKVDEVYEFDLTSLHLDSTYAHINNKKIENKFYSYNIPKNWDYAMVSPEKDKDNLKEYRGYLINTNILIQEKVQDICGVSLWISVFSKPNKEKLSISNFLESRDKKLSNHYDNLDKTSLKIGNKVVHSTSFSFDDVDPKGRSSSGRTTLLTWIENKSIIEFKFTGCKEYDRYFEQIKENISSFSFKI